MFNKENKPEKFKDAETIIGGSIKVKGNFHGKGNIIVEGQLEGSLKTEANLFIGDKAKIVANIEANDAIINGEIHGGLIIKKYLSLGKTARIHGDIQYEEISVEKGAIINGNLTVKISEPRKKEVTKEQEIKEENDEE